MNHPTTPARHDFSRRRALRLVLAMAAALTSVPLAVLTGSSASAAPVYRVIDADNDPYSGIYLRNGTSMADVSRVSSNYVVYDTSAELVCGTWGEAVGPRANRRWHQVRLVNGANAGRVGWVADRYMNTPNAANQLTPGEPECGSTPAPVLSARGGAAASWAEARLGSAAYRYLCLKFVREAWAAQGVDLKRQVGTSWGSETYPVDIWGRFTAGRSGTGTPPEAGALLFFSGVNGQRTSSHISIYAGGSRVISTDDYLGRNVHVENLGQHARYLGWWLPAS